MTPANLQSTDPYAVLGLPQGASLREVKRAYFDLVRQYPPEEQPDAFKVIRAAYEKLRTPDNKAETDLFLFRPPVAWEPRKRSGKLVLAFDSADIMVYLHSFGDLNRQEFPKDYRPVRP